MDRQEGRGNIVDTTEKRGIKKEVTQTSASGTWKDTDNVYMSNNINRFLVMPLSPNQVNGQFASPIVRASEIVPYIDGNTIQLLGNLNAGGGGGIPTNTATFQYRTQPLYPYQIYNIENTVSALASTVGSTPTLAISFPSTNHGTVDFTDANVIFNTENVSPYTMRLNGSMGINTDPNGYALNINGSARVSGTIDISNATVSQLGIGTSVAPGYVFDVSGASQFRGAITARQTITSDTLITGNQLQSTLDTTVGTTLLVNGTSRLSGNVGIGQAATAYSLDVLGQVNVSDTLFTNNLQARNNIDLSGNLSIANQLLTPGNKGNVGIGTSAVQVASTNNSLSVAGNTNLLQNVYVNQRLAVGETPGFSFPSQFYVNGTSQLQGTVAIGSPVAPQILTVYGNGYGAPSLFTGDLTVQGTLQASGGSSQGSADISGNLQVSGSSTLNGTLDVSGATLLRRTLTVGTALQPANANITGNLDVSGTSLLTGNVGMSGTLDVSGTSLLTGNVGMSGTLDVSGTTLLTGNVGMSGNLDVSGTSLLTGNVGMSGTLDVSGAALITGNLNYNVYTERITYQVSAHQSILPFRSPGYWEASANRINLYMPLKPAIYIIDGSTGSTVDLSVNLVTPLPYTQPTGMIYTFVARNTTGAGHRLVYPYDTGGVHSSTLIPAPLSTMVVCIGQNNYSSTS